MKNKTCHVFSVPQARGNKRHRVTDFQCRVYTALLDIPQGRVTTYGLLARKMKCGSAQAVGQALRCNPFAPRVPCHRVIASTLTIGGFHGARSGAHIQRKRDLLAREGVLFTSDGFLRDSWRIFRWDAHSGCHKKSHRLIGLPQRAG